MTVRVGDIVKVRRVPQQSARLLGRLLGQTGFVEKLNEEGTRAMFHAITPAGRHRDLAWLPVGCLEPVNDPAWAAAVSEYRRWAAQVARERQAWEQRRWRQLQALARQYGLSVSQIIEIADAAGAQPPDRPHEE